jgi:hypothetical protein
VTLYLAHSTAGGGSFDEIALAVGLILLGLAFLVQKSLDRKISILLVVIGLVGLIGSQTFLKNVGGGNTITVQGQEFEEEELVGAIQAMCTARSEVEDFEAAQTTFLSRAHVPLHVIAAAVEDEDRELAGRMLEIKQKVEVAFAGDAPPDELEAVLDDLIEVTAEALAALDIPADTC